MGPRAVQVRLRRLGLAIPVVLAFWIAAPARSGGEGSARPVGMIVLETPDEAGKMLNQLRAGGDFASLARQFSIDASAKDGGYLGPVDPANLRQELRDALQRLKPGQVSEVVKIPSGYAILKLLPGPDREKDLDAERARIVARLASVRLAQDESGYGEFFQAFRNILPPEPKLREWQTDLKNVCATREQAPRDGIQALQKLIANESGNDDVTRRAYSRYALGQLYSSQRDFDTAIKEMEAAYQVALQASNYPLAWHMEEVLAINYLHRGAFADPGTDPVINESLLFPSHPSARKTKPEDIHKAIGFLSGGVKRDPSNTQLQWLLNLAYMAADEYPTRVPKEFLIPPSAFASKEDLGRFLDVAPAAGLATFGSAGGAIIDDFDNDGFLDIVTSQVDDCAPLHYFHNNGDGTFTDRARAAGIADQMGGLNITQVDYNNDGCMDIFVMRGGWEFARRHSLLRNNCDGTFADVTAQSGLLDSPLRPSQAAVWTDIDNDGNLDLFIANENTPSQLFLSKGDGTFIDISHEAGIDRVANSKGVAVADYDGDGHPDIYVSNFTGFNFLYHNNRDSTFTEVSQEAGVSEPWMSFAAWFFDYNNDGLPDLFVNSFFMSVEEVARSYMGLPRKGETLKLYKNLGNGKFKNVSAEVNLDRIFMPMGSNFGDIDNDGYLDIYLGNGSPSYASMIPNVLLHNQGGKHFVDISASSGTGALAKGHGVAFGDLNNDGDEDLFVVMGGPHAGDRYPSRLFENPGKHGNDWITLHLVGVTSNRGAVGAHIAVTVVNEGGERRTIWRTVSSGGSFGASPLQQHVGLGKAAKIEKIEISWPASKSKQTFENVSVNQFIEIKEFEKTFTRLTRRSFQLGAPARQAQHQAVTDLK